MASRPRWLELAVPASAEAVEAVSEILDRFAAGGIAVDEPVRQDPTEWNRSADRGTPSIAADHLVKAYLLDDDDSAGRIERVREALGHLQAFDLGPIGEPRIRLIENTDWLQAWKASFKPIRVGSFLVRPTWSDATEDAGLVALVLDPGMAFGTGLHPTTQQCLAWLSTADLAGRSVADIGCGSGILAIAAAKRGARGVVAVDTDPLAVDAARENAAVNGVAVAVAAGSAEDVAGAFAVVLANIVAPVLRRIAPDLAARVASGGTLVLAGIVAEDEPRTLEPYLAAGLRLVSRAQTDVWVSAVLERV